MVVLNLLGYLNGDYSVQTLKYLYRVAREHAGFPQVSPTPSPPVSPSLTPSPVKLQFPCGSAPLARILPPALPSPWKYSKPIKGRPTLIRRCTDGIALLGRRTLIYIPRARPFGGKISTCSPPRRTGVRARVQLRARVHLI